jgi:methyltransferase
MPSEAMGPAQVAALLVLIQRGFEELHSQRNTRRLLEQGAVEVARDYYPVVAVTHLGWIASMFLLIPRGAEIIWPILVIFLVLQVARYWVIGTLGRYWTHRILTLATAPTVTAGPYRWVRHPNYVIASLEALLLPAAFGAFSLGLIMASIFAVVLCYKGKLEHAALAPRRQAA